MEILYQYRCNLVHGCKNIHLEENVILSKYLSNMIILIFNLLPETLISDNVKNPLNLIKYAFY